MQEFAQKKITKRKRRTFALRQFAVISAHDFDSRKDLASSDLNQLQNFRPMIEFTFHAAKVLLIFEPCK